MIIDSHLHVYDRPWQPEWLWRFFREYFDDGMPESKFDNEFVPNFCDPTGEKLIQEMDRAGVDKSVILCIDWGLVDPEEQAVMSIRDQNGMVASICERYPDRLMFGLGVDPRRTDALDILEEGVRDLGARAVKFYPPAGFFPNDKAFYRFYEKCCELGVPIQTHSGPIRLHTLRMKYSHPIHWSDVAVDFPDLTIILAHCSLHWWRDCLGVASFFPNIVCDIGWFANIVHPEAFGDQGAYKHEKDLGKPAPDRFWHHVREIFTQLRGRIMFASDYNGLKGAQEAHVQLYSDWDAAGARLGLEFAEEEMEDFFWRTANRVYGLGLG